MKHLFESFNLSKATGISIDLKRCQICKAIKISIAEYNKNGIKDDYVYLRGSKYCGKSF